MRHGKSIMGIGQARVSGDHTLKMRDGFGGFASSEADAAEQQHGVVVPGVTREDLFAQGGGFVEPPLGQRNFGEASGGGDVVRGPLHDWGEWGFGGSKGA